MSTPLPDNAEMAERLRLWVKAHFGKWITHRTAMKVVRYLTAADRRTP